MTILKLEIDLDWLGEEGDLSETIKTEVLNSVEDRITSAAFSSIQERVNSLINEKINTIINDKLNEILDDFVNKKRTITDKYGDAKEVDVSVIDIMKKAFDNYLVTTVDKDGRVTTGYGCKKRIDYIIDNNMDYTMKRTIDKAAEEIKRKMQEYVETTIKTQIGENVATIIGLDSIIKKMEC